MSESITPEQIRLIGRVAIAFDACNCRKCREIVHWCDELTARQATVFELDGLQLLLDYPPTCHAERMGVIASALVAAMLLLAGCDATARCVVRHSLPMESAQVEWMGELTR